MRDDGENCFSNGKICFKYPRDWTITTLVDDEKFEGKNQDQSVELTIHRKSDLTHLSFDELMEVWDTIFQDRQIKMTSKKVDKKENREIFTLTGENTEKQNKILIAGYKCYRYLYYMHFIIKPEQEKREIDLITNTFHINKIKHTST